jgi:outer membrane protein assembly factor BamB
MHKRIRVATSVLVLVVTTAFSAAEEVPFLTVTSKDHENVIEWQFPPTLFSGFVRVIGRTDHFPTAPDDIDPDNLFAVDVPAVSGEHASLGHPGLTPGATVFYAAFVFDGESFSAGKTAIGIPVDATGPIQWRFFSGATAMAPPGIGAYVLALSNDENLYAMKRGDIDGGTWPDEFIPRPLFNVAQHRPAVVPIAFGDSENFTIISTQDGFVHSIDVDVGTEIWVSESLGMLQAGPVGWFSFYSGLNHDLILVGTRIAGQRNTFYALDASDGSVVWSFDDPAGPGIGIISGAASIDYTRSRLYFASHAIAEGADSVWALDLETGDKVWSTPLGNVSGSAVVRGDDLYVGTDDGLIQGIDVTDGSVKLNFPFDTGDGATRGFVFPDYASRRIYVSTQTTVWCLRDVEPVVIREWSQPGIPDPSTPVVPSGSRFLWVGSSNGRLYQLDLTTGNPSQPPVTSSVLLNDGTAGVGSPSYDVANALVYVGAEDGVISAVRAPF